MNKKCRKTLEQITHLLEDLGPAMSSAYRYQKLINGISELFPCDAVSLQKLDTDYLYPVALWGLPEESHGRRLSN